MKKVIYHLQALFKSRYCVLATFFFYLEIESNAENDIIQKSTVEVGGTRFNADLLR